MTRSRFSRRAVNLFLTTTLGLAWLPAAQDANAAPDPKAIMAKFAEARKLDGSEAVVKMSIVNEKGQVRERTISMATKLYDGGKTEKRIYRFLAPADIKGTGILVYDYDNKADDIWIYMPAMKKTRRIVSSQQSKGFMGSEFSYADLNVPALDDYNYKFVKEENYGGEATYVIEVIPKNDGIAKSEGYSKKTLWLSKKSSIVRRGLYYDLDGKLFKELKSDDVKLLDPKKKRYRAMKMEMVNKKNNRRSVFQTEKVALSPNAKDEYFTARYLERQ